MKEWGPGTNRQEGASVEAGEAKQEQEKPAVIFRVVEKTDRGSYEGYYVSMPDGGRKLVSGKAPPEEELGSSKETLYQAFVPSSEEIKKVLDSHGVESPDELRARELKRDKKDA